MTNSGLTRYLVGGAVRDQLLGRPVKDRDWVVVGETHASMLARGFKPVGRDFPVYLHPETGEEHALARRERSTGPGHGDFAFDTAGVTLEQDLGRRDLTINAMAFSEEGALVDPFRGEEDLRAGVLRHIDADAFAEDPLRVLRVARFAAQLRFAVAYETVFLMSSLAEELSTLTAERVFHEVDRALASEAPQRFFECLCGSDCLRPVLPEVADIIGVPEHPEYHPEGGTWEHTMLVLQEAAMIRPGDSILGWAALCHDLGKAETPVDALPLHPGHEKVSERIARDLLGRLRAPAALTEAVSVVSRQHMRAKRYHEMRPGKILRMMERIGALRDRSRLALLLDLCEADDRGRNVWPNQERNASRRKALVSALESCTAIRGRDALAGRDKAPGPWVGQLLVQMRVAAIREALAQ